GQPITPAEEKSLQNVLEGKPWRGHDVLYWEHQGNRAVRQDKWKIVLSYPENRWRLFDIEKDRTELHDLSAQNPEKVRELDRLYDAWAKKVQVGDWATLSVNSPK